MAKVEVLVAAMHQKDTSLYEKMRIQTDAVICNQADRLENTCVTTESGHTVRMYTTADRGVGKNRNLALANAAGDICLLADADVIYADGYEKTVLDAFHKYPKADAIIFGLRSLNRDRPLMTIQSDKRIWWGNAMSFGACRVAFRRERVWRANIWFSILFGGGARYGSGEDSLFIWDMLKAGLKLYKVTEEIGVVSQETSSWFKGYNDQYFMDKGALMRAMTGRLSGFFILVMAAKSTIRLSGAYSLFQIIRLMRRGAKEYRCAR